MFTLVGYKIVFKYNGKVRYSTQVYPSKDLAIVAGEKLKSYSTVIPFYN